MFAHYLVFAIPILIGSSQIRACETDPFLFQMPGETVAQANERSKQIADSFDIFEHYERELGGFDKAKSVYLGKVISRQEGTLTADKQILPSTVVRPVKSLKGPLPKGDRTLTDQAWLASGMCSDVGDGEGATADVGKLIVVFEGVPKTQYRLNGLDSFALGSIRTVPLLDLVRAQGKDLEE